MENYYLAKDIIKEAVDRLKPFINIFNSIPYTQVCSGDNMLKYENQYALSYNFYFGSVTTCTRYYLFSKEKANKIIKLFSICTNKLQEEITNIIAQRNLSDKEVEAIRRYTNHVGYTFEKLDEVENWQRMYEIKRPPVPRNRRKYTDEDDYYDYEEDYSADDVCSCCRGGGCPHCEPSFFC